MSKNITIVILAIVVIAVAGGIALFYLQDPVALACKEFKSAQYETSCEQAVEAALQDSPGKIKNVQPGLFAFQPRLAEVLNKTEQQMWLIDIELETPATTFQGKTVGALRIGVPLDGSPSIFHTSID